MPPCGVPRSVGQPLSFGHHPGREHLPEQAQHATVRDSLVDQVQGASRGLRTRRNLSRSASTTHSYPSSSSLHILRSAPWGGPPAPVPVVGIIEYRLEDRLQPVHHRLLTHPIERSSGCRADETSPAGPPWESGIGEPAAAHTLRPATPGADDRDSHRAMPRTPLKSSPIHATGTPVALHLLPGHLQDSSACTPCPPVSGTFLSPAGLSQ